MSCAYKTQTTRKPCVCFCCHCGHYFFGTCLDPFASDALPLSCPRCSDTHDRVKCMDEFGDSDPVNSNMHCSNTSTVSYWICWACEFVNFTVDESMSEEVKEDDCCRCGYKLMDGGCEILAQFEGGASSAIERFEADVEDRVMWRLRNSDIVFIENEAK